MSSFDLTPKEKEIVELVCVPLKNKEIASRLGVGEKTVAIHLCHIYSKLGISNRTQLFLIVMPDSFKKPFPPIEDVVKKPKRKPFRRKFKSVKPIVFNAKYKKELYEIKVQRLKAALMISSMIDCASTEEIKKELNELMTVLQL